MSPSVLVRPAFASCPPYVETLGPEVAELAASAGFPPDPEQALALDMLFGFDANNRSTAFEFALICARQNMKSALFEMAVLGWLFLCEQRLVVWSAHEFSTTKEAFLHLAALIENCPHLRRQLASGPSHGIYRGSGAEAIHLASGQRLLFKARTTGGGTGLTGDRVILDEAWALKPQHLASLLPTVSARPDPQIVYGSSAAHADSDILRGIVARGRAATSLRMAYMEYCAPENMCTDLNCSHALGVAGCALDNLDYVRMANPAMGRRISVENLLAERQALPPAEYGRERLGWHDKPDIDAEPLILAGKWQALTDETSAPTDPVAFGLYVSADRSCAAIGVAGRRPDGMFHVGVVPAVRGTAVDALPGTGWIAGRLKELFDEWRPCAIVVDAHSAAASLITAIEEQEIPVVQTVNTTDVAKACGTFFDAVNEGNLRHTGAGPLHNSVTAGKRRDLNDAWVWDRKDKSADITQLVAVTLALHGLVEYGQVQEVWGVLL